MKTIWGITFEIIIGIIVLVVGYNIFKEISKTSTEVGLFFLFSVIMLLVIGLSILIGSYFDESKEVRE